MATTKRQGKDMALQYRLAAEMMYCGHGGQFEDGDINIDSDAVVSESDEGAYVAAWVWVPGRPQVTR